MGMWRNTRNGWGVVSISFHWLSALAVIGLFLLGWWMTGLGYYHPWYNQAPWIHRSIGILLLLVTAGRMTWRLLNATPESEGSRFERIAAHLGHIGIYVLLLLVMLSGYLISTANGRGVSVFGWFEMPALLHGLPNQASVAGDIHWYSAVLLLIVAAGHALAAMKHHFHDRHRTLVRMVNPAHSRRPG